MDTLDTLPWKSRVPTPVIAKDEKILRGSRPHWMRYVLPTFVYLLLGSLGTAFFLFLPAFPNDTPAIRMGLFFGALILFLILQHWYFHLMLSENVTDIILTTKRALLLRHKLWFLDTIDEFLLLRIKMVKARKQGLLQHLFDYGDLLIDIGGGQRISYVPSPDSWAQHIERMLNIS